MLSSDADVPHTVLSMSPLVPQTTFSPVTALVPQTMLSSFMAAVPHTAPAQLAPPQLVPHTMLSSSSAIVPQTMLSSSSAANVPQTMLSSLSEAVPHTMLSSESIADHVWLLQLFLHSVPQTMFWPVAVLGAPQTTPAFHALAFGLITPCVIRWLPQLIAWLHSLGCG